jgi:hypothetical protein
MARGHKFRPTEEFVTQRIQEILACRTDEVFALATDPRFEILCSVTRDDDSIGGSGIAQYFPVEPPPGDGIPWNCLSTWLSPEGVIAPTSHYKGMVEVFQGGPVWGDWHDDNGAGWIIEEKDLTCLANTIQGTASDGHTYSITMTPFWTPIPNFRPGAGG